MSDVIMLILDPCNKSWWIKGCRRTRREFYDEVQFQGCKCIWSIPNTEIESNKWFIYCNLDVHEAWFFKDHWKCIFCRDSIIYQTDTLLTVYFFHFNYSNFLNQIIAIDFPKLPSRNTALHTMYIQTRWHSTMKIWEWLYTV